jgi:hypothetical protein
VVVITNRLAVFAQLDHGNFDGNRGTSSGRDAAEYTRKGPHMNGYEKAVELGLSGTAAEQVAILQTLTVSDINVKAVQRWFRENELWMQGPSGKMFGELQAAYAHESTPPEAIAGLDYLFATIFGDSAETLQTTNPTWSVKVWQLVQLVVQLVPQATGLVDSFYELEGGRPYKDYTTEQYETDAATAAAAAERGNVVTACLSPIRTVQAASATRLNNAIASLGPEHIDGLTLEELQARCDAVAASDDGLVAE